MNKKIAVVFNPASGSGKNKRVVQSEIDKLKATHFEVDEFPLPKEERKIPALFQKVVAGGYDTIIACGGDGTVNGLAEQMVGTDIPLLVIPAGTFNHFAKHLKLPQDISEAFGVLQNGEVKIVDTGEVNGRPFVNFSSVGVYTEVIRERIHHERIGRRKWPAFFYSLVKNIYRHRVLRLSIHRGTKEVEERTPFVFVGNNPFLFGGPGILKERECFDRGVLHLVIARERSRIGLFKMFWSVLRRNFENSRNYSSVYLQKFDLHSGKKKLHVSIDGEVVCLKTPLRYKIRSQSLKVYVPKR